MVYLLYHIQQEIINDYEVNEHKRKVLSASKYFPEYFFCKRPKPPTFRNLTPKLSHLTRRYFDHEFSLRRAFIFIVIVVLKMIKNPLEVYLGRY